MWGESQEATPDPSKINYAVDNDDDDDGLWSRFGGKILSIRKLVLFSP